MESSQSLYTKKMEVQTRKKLTEQHLYGKTHFPYELGPEEMLRELKVRVEATRVVFNQLIQRGISLSPFLEIGAEKCQRSMLLTSEFNAQGFATDLSLESLAAANQLRHPLGLQKIPARACCDAYHLPFANNSFSFVFTFQTLHHFPDPIPIIKEITRVLKPNGYFYFGEEPIKQKFNLNFWRRPTKLRSYEKILKYIGLLPFLSRIGKTEVDLGIEENEFDLNKWQESFNLFHKVEVKIKPAFFGKPIILSKHVQTNWFKLPFISKLLIDLQGGGIDALCQVKKSVKIETFYKLEELLACPSCPNHPKVIELGGAFCCPVCQSEYPHRDQVLMMLPLREAQILYDQK